MNIDEERKAFENVMGPTMIRLFGYSWKIAGFENGSFDNEPVQEFFEGWLAAKAHAEEMAKPEARYATIGGIVNLYFDVNLSKPGVCSIVYFESVEAAKVWASNNGYRVVEE